MIKKETLAEILQQKWSALQSKLQPIPSCFIGFDGFTDEIIQAVELRTSQNQYIPFSKIKQFGDRIVQAAGKSCNIELVVQQLKLGGNAPIMANALVNGGHNITFCGPIGEPGSIEPVFQEMAARCSRIVALGPSAHSDAIEFEDGKVILGKLEALKNIDYDSIIKHIPRHELAKLLDSSDLFVCANWTMLPMMNELWERLLSDIIPEFKEKKTRNLFVDLADPAKRVDADIKKAMELLERLNVVFRVHLGLNKAEAQRIEHVLSGAQTSRDPEDLVRSIQNHTKLHRIIVHTTSAAASMGADGLHRVDGPYTSTPKITTGAGDNFNAGYCNALLYNLDPEACLLAGTATSGFYVRNGYSPSIPELGSFLRKWEARELE